MFTNKIVVTESQKEVLEFDSNLIVSGPAGSGKTFLTILLSDKILKEDPSAKIQIIVFTKSLKAFIIKGLENIGITNVVVNHLASWVYNKKESDYMIIDEAQDLSLDELDILKSYSKKKIYFFGDSNQMIYNNQLKGSSIEEIIDHFGYNHIVLREILRFNTGIKDFISESFPFVNEATVLNKKIIKPNVLTCKDEEDEISKICDILINRSKIESIGILVFLNQTVSKLLEEFSKRNLRIDGYKVYSDENLSLNKGSINILTYHSAKGLDFDTIIMPFLDDGHGFNNNIYYVGFTRAKENLYILYKNNFPLDLNIRNKNAYTGEIHTDNVFEMAKFEIELNFLFYLEVYKDIYTKEQIKIKFKTELEKAKENARLTLKYSNLTDEEIELWINNEIER
jgi:hypothetical protein